LANIKVEACMYSPIYGIAYYSMEATVWLRGLFTHLIHIYFDRVRCKSQMR